jgi:hypothetical protein
MNQMADQFAQMGMGGQKGVSAIARNKSKNVEIWISMRPTRLTSLVLISTRKSFLTHHLRFDSPLAHVSLNHLLPTQIRHTCAAL